VTADSADPDIALALRAQRGEKQAFDLLVVRHRSGLYRFARRYVGNEDDAYDIVQETFISAWRSLSRYDPERGFATWLRAIALNKCRDFGRRQTARRQFLRLFAFQADTRTPPERDPELRSEEDRNEAKRLQALDRAIAALPAFYKEPLLLITVSGLTQEETARQLNTTTKAIEMRIRRAKKKLTETLSEFAREG
jgi:RNA polymerase sigma-70 factor (ECF subfamily)